MSGDPHFVYSLEVRIIDLEQKLAELEKKLQALSAADDAPNQKMPAKIQEQIKRGENAVRVFRLHRGLTQQQLSEMTGIRANHISAIENGMRFGLKTARKISDALDVPFSWLT